MNVVRRRLIILSVIISVCLFALSPAIAAETSHVDISVNGKAMVFDVKPFIDKNNRTLVPIRFVSEELGYKVDWDRQEKKVSVKNTNKNIILTINSKNTQVNGINKTIDTQAVLVNSRTMVPLRFISEEMGLKVDYNSKNNKVSLNERISAPVSGLKVVDTVKITVSADSMLNVRTKPRTDQDNVMAQVKRGGVYRVTKQETGWYGIDYNGETGWITADYASPVTYKAITASEKQDSDSANEPEKKPDVPTKNIKKVKIDVSHGSTLNVRNTASLTGYVLGKVARNDTFKYLGSEGNWYKIDYANTTGYIHQDYATLIEEEKVDIDKVAAKKGRINSPVVNVRTNPVVTEEDTNRLTQVMFGSTYNIIDQTAEWYKIDLGQGQQGWLVKRAMDLLDDAGNLIAADGIEVKNLAKVLIIDKNGVNIRKAPTTSSEVLVAYDKKEVLPIVGVTDDWYKVSLADGRIGYVASKLGSTRTEFQFRDQVEETERKEIARITDIRIENDQILVSSDKDILYRVFLLNDPARAMISLYDAEIADELLTRQSVSGTMLKGISLSRYGEQQVRMMLDFSQASMVDVASTTNSNQKDLSFKVKSAPLVGKTIVIDPGHGAYNEKGRFDVGATSPSGIYEYIITNDIGMDINNRLIALGANVILTHNDQEVINMSLDQRVAVANNSKADMFLSVHSDSFPSNRNVSGMATYYYHGNGNVDQKISLAKNILDGLCKYTGRPNKGIKNKGFRVLKYTKIPSVLVEVGFLSNPVEEKLLQTSSFRSLAAEGIVEGIMNYFGVQGR